MGFIGRCLRDDDDSDTWSESSRRDREAQEMQRKADEKILEHRNQRDAAYHERNQLVAFLSRIYPSHLAQHPTDPAWDPEWCNIVCIHAPCGQMCWHIHANEVPLFTGLGYAPNDWDGHTIAEKYERLAKLGLDANGNSVGSMMRAKYDAAVDELLAWVELVFACGPTRERADRVRELREKLGIK